MAYHGPKDGGSPIVAAGAWECDLQTQELIWTDGVYDLFELPRGMPLRRAATVEMYYEDCRRQMERLRAAALQHGRGFVLEARIHTDRGASRWMRLTAGVVWAEGRAVRLLGAKQDITHERELWERLRQRADCDALTGLANRAVFDTLCHDLARGQRDDVAAMAMIDLDHFKQINDQLGHAAGDECLRQLAERLRWAFGDTVLVARIGGDEFVVMLRGPLGRVRLEALLARVLPVLCQPVLWSGVSIDISVSIGAALRRRAGRQEPSRLFAEADAALYRAKTTGRKRACLEGGGGIGIGLPERMEVDSLR
jgi:diguanylate cyclase (GGDEF)-like protein